MNLVSSMSEVTGVPTSAEPAGLKIGVAVVVGVGTMLVLFAARMAAALRLVLTIPWREKKVESFRNVLNYCDKHCHLSHDRGSDDFVS